MRRALLIAVFLLIAAAPKDAGVADQARQRAMDRDESRAQARTAAEEIVRLRQQLIGLGAEEKTGEKTVGSAPWSSTAAIRPRPSWSRPRTPRTR
jgi:hypothetical protein